MASSPSSSAVGVLEPIAAVNLLAPAADDLEEAARVAGICNACRYCESLCPVFSEMTRYRHFGDSDLQYLANLCHNCGACYDVCQYAAPHPFAVSVPAALAALRTVGYQQYAWPGSFATLLKHNPVAAVLLLCASLACLLVGLMWAANDASLWVSHSNHGSFYAVIPHGAMVLLAAGSFGFALLCLAAAAFRFARAIELNLSMLSRWDAIARALVASITLRYWDGGRDQQSGQHSLSTTLPSSRRLWHHFMAGGFLLCFAATCVATWYHYGLGQPAPYDFLSLPVVLGTLGGLGLIVGPLGLAHGKKQAPSAIVDVRAERLGNCLLALLAWASVTGLALLFGRDSVAMWLLLAVHLGAVFSLFLLLPFSKFLHAPLRFLALLKYFVGQVPKKSA